MPSETNPMEKTPYVPIEFHVSTIKDKLGILTIHTTEGRLDIALDGSTADAIVSAIKSMRATL